MPIEGNGMKAGPGSVPGAKPHAVKVESEAVDPITAAVTAAVGKTQTTVNPAAKEVKAEKKPGSSEVVFDPNMPRDELERQLIERHRPVEKPVYVPPPPTPKQLKQTEAEQEAGRRRVKYYAQLNRQRVAPPPNPRDGTNTPVLRSGDYQHERNTNKATSV